MDLLAWPSTLMMDHGRSIDHVPGPRRLEQKFRRTNHEHRTTHADSAGSYPDPVRWILSSLTKGAVDLPKAEELVSC